MSTISIKELEKAVATAADVVRYHGDKYWPIFERVERELVERRSREDRLDQYKKSLRKREAD